MGTVIARHEIVQPFADLTGQYWFTTERDAEQGPDVSAEGGFLLSAISTDNEVWAIQIGLHGGDEDAAFVWYGTSSMLTLPVSNLNQLDFRGHIGNGFSWIMR